VQGTPGSRSPPAPDLTREDLKWLHDKYERLAAEEGQLATSRTTYYAAIGTVLITGLLIAVVDLLGQPTLLALFVTFLAALGLLISAVWAVLLHRTNDAQNLWREAALRLEMMNPPLVGEFLAPISLRSGASLELNLLRPFQTHRERFSPRRPISALDRVNPSVLTEVLPLSFIMIWSAVLAGFWVWFLLYR
jgi:uncharacterized membrane protein YhaH (DUF805 family)